MPDKFDMISCPVCQTRHVSKGQRNEGGIFAANCENCGHFFKYRVVPPFKTSVTFTVNSISYTVGNEFSATTSLADFLRDNRVSMGTKIMCKQGGCGICVVEAKMVLDPNQPKVAANLNACLCPVFMCDGWEITTVEGLGSTRTGLHQIQSNLADFMGTQCGYCSPGQVMNMYGLTQKYQHMTKQFVEDHFEGNLCRCTGYRPILDAFKAMVPSASDIEDLSATACSNDPNKQCKSNGHCSGGCTSSASAARTSSVKAVNPVRMVFGSVQWIKAADYAELLALLQQHSGKKIRLLGANTGTGAFWSTENIGNFEVVIDISGVPDFYVNTYDASTSTFTIGASVTLSDMIDLFSREAARIGSVGGFDELTKYLYRVASSPIRNRASWAGNLMLKNHIPTFPSDVFNIMTALKASLYIGPTPQDFVTPDTFATKDMTGKALSKATFRNIPANDVIACFKVMPRSQNSLALVNAAIRCTIDPKTNFTVSGQPIISIGGINGTFHRASKTEAYLIGKQLGVSQTLAGAMVVLSTELVPSNDINLSSPAYRKIVACALLYKYFLRVLGTAAGARYRSGSTVLHDTRPLSSGTQSYDTKKVEWPLNEPLKKLEADIQCTGEAEFTDDIAPLPGQLYASFVKSTKANATIQNIDTSAAMGLTGVVRVLTATDIPTWGKNDIYHDINNPGHEVEEILSSGPVHYYGQPVALVLADTQEIADQAAFMVKVTYTNIQTPVLTIDDAIQKSSIVPTPQIKDIVVGNADQAIAMSQYITSGSFYLGSQYHFHMETQCSLAIPTAEGIKMITTTQQTEGIQQVVSQICAIPKAKVRVEVDRLGGGFGGKITRNAYPAGACGLAAYLTNRPVRMRMALWDNMDIIGKRNTYKACYEVGHDVNGKINGIIVTYYGDLGCYGNEVQRLQFLLEFLDNGYFCANWKAKIVGLRTNKPAATACRSPGSVPGIFFMEQMMEHVARTLNKDPLSVKALNLYKTGQVTPVGMTLTHCNLTPVLNELMSSAQVTSRQQNIASFNRDNRWKKRALSVVPMKWGVGFNWTTYSALVNIHGGDGTVLVHHGGVEMGQGINTKVAQVCAYELDIPVTMVTVTGTNTVIDVNNSATGGSVTSEVCCQAVVTCCTNIKARMAPVKAKMTTPTWVELVNKCLEERVSLSEKVVNSPSNPPPFEYNTYGATCSEVEIDVLTGEYQISRVDIVYDCGESLNPAVDIGQVEGAFIMGLGYSTSEDVQYDPTSGQLLTTDTWTYHPPTNKDIPVDFRISLLKNSPNPSGVLRSKLSGEPPLCMSCSVFFALRKCIEEARKEAGSTAYFDFNPPATVEKVQMACLVNTSQFLLH